MPTARSRPRSRVRAQNRALQDRIALLDVELNRNTQNFSKPPSNVRSSPASPGPSEPNEYALIALQQCLKSADCEVTDIIDHRSVHSVYFTDPNRITLEAAWWVLDATGRAADYGDDRFFVYPKPVPVLNELRATGSPTTVPNTRLS